MRDVVGIGENIIRIIVLLILFALVHLAKMMRLYLVFLEEKIEFKRFVFAYFRTTLVNLIIPFKLGELYRMFDFSRICKSGSIGIFGVLIDRFFDTAALVLLLIPLGIIYPKAINFVSIMLIVGITVIIFIYLIFMPSYRYLNKYIIMNRSSKRSMAVLRGLEVLRNGFDYVKGLILGRYALLILLSFGAWIFEGFLLFLLARVVKVPFTGKEFAEYVASILSLNYSSSIKGVYSFMSIVLILLFTAVSMAVYLAREDSRLHRR